MDTQKYTTNKKTLLIISRSLSHVFKKNPQKNIYSIKQFNAFLFVCLFVQFVWSFCVEFVIIIMEKSEILKEIQSIQKEDYCEKQSRFLKSWRQRWIVLTNNLIISYKQRRHYENPTEVIELKEIISIKTCDEEQSKKNIFKIETNETTFYFACESSLQKEQWIGAIGKAMVKRNNRDMDD